MTKSIYRLIPDIYQLIQRKDGWFTDELANTLSQEISLRLQKSFNEDKGAGTLRISRLGNQCPCALWHSLHTPELAEAMPPWAEVKFAYGHILEALAIALAKASGHEVVGEQDEVCIDGVLGHRDCVIDGCVVDVKSCSSIAFRKYKDKTLNESNDSFGYLEQLDGYVVASHSDPLVSVKDKGYILAIDKTLGHMALYEARVRRTDNGEFKIKQRIAEFKRISEQLSPPICNCETVSDGKSGNIKLGIKASYSSYKYCCFPNLRTFVYSDGPRYLTHVARKPDVLEVNKHGQPVYIS